MTQDTEVTPVIFRMFNEPDAYWQRDLIALFPTVDEGMGKCSSYIHIGQHCGADYHRVIDVSRPATPEEYAPLVRELESDPYGYNLKVHRRWNWRWSSK